MAIESSGGDQIPEHLLHLLSMPYIKKEFQERQWSHPSDRPTVLSDEAFKSWGAHRPIGGEPLEIAFEIKIDDVAISSLSNTAKEQELADEVLPCLEEAIKLMRVSDVEAELDQN